MKLSNILNEMHYKDLYGAEFDKFRKKYTKLLKDNHLSKYNIFVNFTSYSYNDLDRSFNEDPSHSDPAGLYAYPLDYVLKYPADIWYGAKARYLRVIEAKKNVNILNLTYLEEYRAFELLKKVYGADTSMHMRLVKKHFKTRLQKPSTEGYWGRVFFQCAQIPMSILEKLESKELEVGDIRSGINSAKEQRSLLTKMGITAVKDTPSRKNYAVINDREPEQILFLDKTSFSIKETFILHERGKNDRKGENTSQHPEVNDEGVRLAVKIFAEFGHKIKKFDQQREYGVHYTLFFSDKGFKLSIDFAFPRWVMDTRKMGEKKHKERKLTTYHYPEILLWTDRGEIEYKAHEDESFSEIAETVHHRYLENDPIENWEPYTSEKEISTRKKAHELQVEQNIQKQRKEDLDEASLYKERLSSIISLVKQKFNVTYLNPFDNVIHEETLIDAVKFIDFVDRMVFSEQKNFDELYKMAEADYFNADEDLSDKYKSFLDMLKFLESKGMSLKHNSRLSFIETWLEEYKPPIEESIETLFFKIRENRMKSSIQCRGNNNV